jgi:hypothetical protein
MASITTHGLDHAKALKERKPLPPDPSCQPCPDCGGLECLCRPRFFAGQLLSEQDLNRLDQYIVEKNKLHNRHLFGSGVVCGLEVKCSPCDNGFVTVTAGYALSPCGEDIIVCKNDTVDICALIARCRVNNEPDCAPYRGQDSCGEVIEDWILSIRYAESPSRGVTPLTGAGQSCGCSCAGPCSGKCGGGKACGCGGGPACSCGAAKGLAEPEPLRQPRLNRGAPPSCEPTLTCETYRYDVFRAPEPEHDDRRPTSGLAGVFSKLQGDLMENIACCLKQLQAALPQVPGDVTNIPANQRQAWFQWGCQMRTAIANYIVRNGGYDCEAIAKLQAIVIPDPGQPVGAFQQAMQIVFVQFAVLILEFALACVCSNALPQCPAPGDPRVPLALVKVRRGDCDVISVCNWTPLRKHVLTFPTLEYWFGFIPIIPAIRKVMHRICCELFGLRPRFEPSNDRPSPPPPPPPPPVGGARMRAAAREAPAPEPPPMSFNEAIDINPLGWIKVEPDLLNAVLKRQAESGTTATIGDLARAMLERPNMAMDPALDEQDRLNEIDRISKTGMAAVLAGMTSFAPPVTEIARALAAAPQRDPDIAELKATVARQAEDIRTLKARVTRGFAARDASPQQASAAAGNATAATRNPRTKASTRRKPTK